MWTSHIATTTTKWEKNACRLPNSWTIPCSALRMYIYVPCIYSQGCVFGGVYVLAFTLKDVYLVEFMYLAFTFKDVYLVKCMFLAFTLKDVHSVEFFLGTLYLLSRMCIWWSFYVPCTYSQGCTFGGFMYLAFTLKDVYLVEFLCICIYSQGCIFCGVYAPCIYFQGCAFGGVYVPCIYSPGCTLGGVCVPFKIYSHSRWESL